MQRLTDKVIVIAGGGGIGNEMARRYASEGASVVIGDFSEAMAMEAVKDVTDAGGSAIGRQFDGSDLASAQSLIDAAVKAYGGVDGINVNFANFADAQADTAVDIPLDVVDEMLRVNVRGYYACSQAAIPALVARGGGAIVYTSSAASYMAEPVRVPYAMCKSAVNALMRGVASRHAADNIRANAIAPGVIVTPKFATEADPKLLREQFLSKQLFKERYGTPADIAAMSALLISEEGRYITGQVLSVDGGLVLRP